MRAARWLHSTEQRAWRGFLDLHAELSSLLNQDVQRTSGLSLADYDVLAHLTDVLDTRRRPSGLAGKRCFWPDGRPGVAGRKAGQ